MITTLKWKTIWVIYISSFVLTQLSKGSNQGLHVIKAPSSKELLAQKTNGTTLVSVVVTNDDPLAIELLPDDHEAVDEDHTPESGRSIVTALGQQASNIGKGFMEFLRGNPHQPPQQLIPPRRPIVPYPGPSMMRPHPMLANFIQPQGRPAPHLTLSSEAMINSNDRAGLPLGFGINGNDGNKLIEGGFLPTKNIFQDLSDHHTIIQPSSSSVAINISAIVLPAPKAPCDFYTESLCIETHPYPAEQMRNRLRTIELGMSNVRRMLADVGQQNANILVDGLTVQEEVLYNYEHYYGSEEDNNTHSYRDYATDGGFVCPSDIKYVRPQKGQSANGKWKFIVNFDNYIQTMRLEKCLKPYSRCSYVFSYLNSECIQIYNYHRLLAWDVEQGFHVDIFKIPTACSCHIRSDSKANTVMSDSMSTSSSKLTIKSDRKKLIDEMEMATEKSYGVDRLDTLKTNPPQLPLVGAVHHMNDHHIRQLPQKKPSRFMLGDVNHQPQFQLDLLLPSHNPHYQQMHRTPDFRLINPTTNSNANRWQRQGYLSMDKMPKLDGTISSSSSIPFRQLGPVHNIRPPPSSSVTNIADNQRRGGGSDVRRVNLNRNPVSDYMHTSFHNA